MDTPFPEVSIPIEVIHSYHAAERVLYARMVLDLDLDPVRSMEVMAFWLWLDEIGHPDVMGHAASLTDVGLRLMAGMAETVVGALDFQLRDEFHPDTDLRYQAIKGIKYYLNSVCHKAFDDIRKQAEERKLEKLILQMSLAHLDQVQTPSPRLYVPHGEGTSRRNTQSIVLPNLQDLEEVVQFQQQLNLLFGSGKEVQRLPQGDRSANYFLQGALSENVGMMGGGGLPYYPRLDGEQWGAGGIGGSVQQRPLQRQQEQQQQQQQQQQRELPTQERTLFVTFSNGYPLTEEDLYIFFTSRFGEVESVSVQNVTKPGTGPLFARVSFHKEETVLRVLNGSEKAKFMFKGKHLWARRFTTMYNRK